jgi:hypothetical protein
MDGHPVDVAHDIGRTVREVTFGSERGQLVRILGC